jgi:hypothetical protein
MRGRCQHLNILFILTIRAATAAAQAIEEVGAGDPDVRSLHSYATAGDAWPAKL